MAHSVAQAAGKTFLTWSSHSSIPATTIQNKALDFEIVFEKSRGLVGDACRSIEAALTADADGKQVWSWTESEGATFDRVVDLKKLGMSNAEIAVELDKDRTTVYRHVKKAKQQGLLSSDA